MHHTTFSGAVQHCTQSANSPLPTGLPRAAFCCYFQARLKVRVVTERAYHALFMNNMLIRPTPDELETFGEPDFVIYNAGAFPANRYANYMTSSTSVDISLKHKEMVILGTEYAGEMKKGVFSVMHYLMPKRGALSLHSGCNMGKQGDVTLFFGLSGKQGGLIQLGWGVCSTSWSIVCKQQASLLCKLLMR